MADVQEIYKRQGDKKMPAREHAFGFLLPIDPRASIRRIGKRLLEAAKTDESIVRKFAAVQQKLGDGRPLIDGEHSAIYERIKCSSVIPHIPTAPEWLRPVIAVAYLRAKAALSTGNVTNFFGSMEESFDKVFKLLDTLEPSFVGELLIETVLSAKEDREFARTLHEGASEFRALVDELYGSDKDMPGDTLARRAASDGSCTCCRTVDGVTYCEPCSCWIIVIIIVIIIVTK